MASSENNKHIENNEHMEHSSPLEDKKYKYKAAAFLTGVAGMSMLAGFGTTLGLAKKKDSNMFNKGIMGVRDLHEAGGVLALRALGWGTIYAVTGFSAFCYVFWKIIGAKNLQDFRLRAGNILPRIPKNENPTSRTDFSGLNDLLQYIIDEDERKKALKKNGLIKNPEK